MTDYVFHKLKMTFPLRHRVRVAAAERGTTMDALITEAIRAYLVSTDHVDPAPLPPVPSPMDPCPPLLLDFVAGRCERDPAHQIRSRDLYEAYIDYARAAGAPFMHDSVFGAAIKKAAPGVSATRARRNGKLIHVYRGIRLRPTEGNEMVTPGLSEQVTKQ